MSISSADSPAATENYELMVCLLIILNLFIVDEKWAFYTRCIVEQ